METQHPETIIHEGLNGFLCIPFPALGWIGDQDADTGTFVERIEIKQVNGPDGPCFAIELNHEPELFQFENILAGIFQVLLQQEPGKRHQGIGQVPDGGIIFPQVQYLKVLRFKGPEGYIPVLKYVHAIFVCKR